MKTALFGLLMAVGQEKAIADFLDNSSFDELLELDIRNKTFHTVFHIGKKYYMPLTEGAYEDIFSDIRDVLVHPDERERFTRLLHPGHLMQYLEDSPLKGLVCEQFRFRLLTGDWRWVEMALLYGERFGLEQGICRLYLFDIHNQKSRELGQATEPLYITDTHNEATGLLHRRAFTKSVTKVLKNTTVNWCLLSVDIENFKLFNEWYGHKEGDLLMMQIGAKLRQTCEKQGGLAGYFGQDDFCLLIPYDIEAIEKLYADIAALISAHGNATGFMPAFGVCMIDDDQSKLRDMLDRAFLAVRFAKKSYHIRIRLFDKSMYRQTDEEYRILNDFIQAMKKNEVVFYLQPQCRVSSGRIVGAEALARWIKPDGTVVSPAAFIPVLEKHGLITDLDLYIWEAVCGRLRRWIDSGNTPLPVSVNVSAMDILNADLPETFSQLVLKYDLPRELLKIEITESAYVDNASLVKNTVQSLREQGFSVLMDDFGNGYSTLNMLKNLSVDVVKLDAQLLAMDETNTEKTIQILESITNMTQTLRIPIIVEGVETERQKEFLKDIGCRYVQGYYFYRPMPVEEYEELIGCQDNIDLTGITFKANRQFHLRELLDNNVYSDNMLNNILGPCAFYSQHGERVDIVRFNEQFYESVGVPDFHDRLNDIRQYIPPADRAPFLDLLCKAEADRLNGSKGVVRFYKTDGTLTSFFMRFFYLRAEGDRKLFFGAVQNITRLTTLERQMTQLARCSHETVVFLRRTPDGSMRFFVLFHGLEEQLGMTREELQDKLNAEDFPSENASAVCRESMDRILHSESFTADMTFRGRDDRMTELTVCGECVPDGEGMSDYLLTVRTAKRGHIVEAL